MKVHFKQPICIGGQDYAVGVHSVPDEHAAHWFCLANKNNGSLVVVEEPKKVPAPVVVEEKSEPVVEEPAEKLEEAPAEVDSAPEAKPSKGSKKKKRG